MGIEHGWMDGNEVSHMFVREKVGGALETE